MDRPAAAPGPAVGRAGRSGVGRRARELAMRALFARDVGQGRPRDVLDYLCAEEGCPAPVREAAGALLAGAVAHLADIDRRIAAYSRDWALPRLAAVDRNVLRIAVFELLHGVGAPAGVVINEAVELAKRYGGEESGRFINGVLGQVVRDREGGTLRSP